MNKNKGLNEEKKNEQTTGKTETCSIEEFFSFLDSISEEGELGDDSESKSTSALNTDALMCKPKDGAEHKFPPLELLEADKPFDDSDGDEEIKRTSEIILNTLNRFDLEAEIIEAVRGPRITRYALVPSNATKVNDITRIYDDFRLDIGVDGVRMVAPIPGRHAIGIEIPNKNARAVRIRDLLESDDFKKNTSTTLSCIGRDITGEPVFTDIKKMPHLLIAGATGMGKSVSVNSMITSVLYKARPDEVKLIMIDPKKVEFSVYNGLPHLLLPVITDMKQGVGAFMWAVEEMERRYDALEKLECRNIDEFNEKVLEHPEIGSPMPKILIVVDELNDIMLQARKPAEELIMCIAQKARAAGIHLILSTQRPTSDVVTGVIKANIPSRMAFKVMSFNDSKTILEQSGAERLINNGDMLYIPAGAPNAVRVQGAFVSDGELTAVLDFLKEQYKDHTYDEELIKAINSAAEKCFRNESENGGDNNADSVLNDAYFIEAVEIAIRSGKVSTSLLQRKIRIGYAKAAKLIDAMEELGIIGAPCGQQPRDVLVTLDEWREMLSSHGIRVNNKVGENAEAAPKSQEYYLFIKACDLAFAKGKISTSMLQRSLGIGYGKAANFIDTMEDIGLISGPCGQKPRDVIADSYSQDEIYAKCKAYQEAAENDTKDFEVVYKPECCISEFLEAVELAVKFGKISASLLQRNLSIGYGKAAKLVDTLDTLGVVGKSAASGKFETFISKEEWKNILEKHK